MSHNNTYEHSTHHHSDNSREWLMERISATIAAPFALWFIMATMRVDTMSQKQFMNWAGKPLNATFILAFVLAATAHARLGLDNVIDDYSRGTWHKIFRLLNRALLGAGLLFCLHALWRCFSYHRHHKNTSDTSS